MNKDKKVVAIGHNQMPNGCEGKFPWNGEESGDRSELDQKYFYGETHSCSFT